MAYPPIDPKVLAFLAEQEKRRKAIVVNNPNDPRLRAYLDSLVSYNTDKRIDAGLVNAYNTSKTNQEFDAKRGQFDKLVNKRNDDLGKIVYKPLAQKPGMASLTDVIEFKNPEQPVVLQRNNGTTRPDGTQKGKGFFGEVKRPDGKVSTELSIGVNIGGKEVLIPTMVPGLTNREIDHLLSGKYKPQARQGVDDIISRKAIQFAEQRASKKQPFFATPQEEGKFKPTPIPAPSPIQPRLAPTNISQPLPQTQPALIPAVIRPTQEPMAQPPPQGKPVETWGPGQRYSLKDEKVRQMLKVIERLKK